MKEFLPGPRMQNNSIWHSTLLWDTPLRTNISVHIADRTPEAPHHSTTKFYIYFFYTRVRTRYVQWCCNQHLFELISNIFTMRWVHRPSLLRFSIAWVGNISLWWVVLVCYCMHLWYTSNNHLVVLTTPNKQIANTCNAIT